MRSRRNCVEKRDRRENGDHEDDREGGGEWPVVGADRLLVDVQRHVHETRAADQRLRNEGRHAGRIGQDAARDNSRRREGQGHAPQRAPGAGAERLRRIRQIGVDARQDGEDRQDHQRHLHLSEHNDDADF